MALVAAVLSGAAAHGEGRAFVDEVAPDPCGHRAELRAATAALARGDREAAANHLRRAKDLLDACSREEGVTPGRAEEGEESVLACSHGAHIPPAQS